MEMDPQLWFYFCQECNYAAHMDCVARDLLSTLRSSYKYRGSHYASNEPNNCDIIQPEESSFKYRITDMRPLQSSHNLSPPMLDETYLRFTSITPDVGTQTDGYELPCPKCNSLIPTQAGYTTIPCWRSSFRENSITTSNDQTPSESEPLSFLEKQIIDELCCSICNMLIFPPTYSCASCQIFFHKSCAELPRKILFNQTNFVLMAPPFPEGLSKCSCCQFPLCSWAYLSVDGIIFDVLCAAGAPLVNPTYHNHVLIFLRVSNCSQMVYRDIKCKACENKLSGKGEFLMACQDCDFYLHLECGLLPSVITNHRIHWHPVELATDLAELYDVTPTLFYKENNIY